MARDYKDKASHYIHKGKWFDFQSLYVLSGISKSEATDCQFNFLDGRVRGRICNSIKTDVTFIKTVKHFY